MRRIVLVLSLCAWLSAAIVPTAVADKKVAFPDGVWEGTAYHTGTVSKDDLFATGKGAVAFQLTVENGEVTDGKLTAVSDGAGSSDTTIATLHFVLTTALYGSADVVKAKGWLKATGEATSYGVTLPLEFDTHVNGAFSPTWVSCNKVTGDLSTQSEKTAQAAGFNANLETDFVAFRVAGTAGVESITKQYSELVDAVLDASGGTPTAAEVLALAKQVDALNAQIAGLGGCDVPPNGFQNGVADTLLASLFQDLLQTALNDPSAYTAQELLALLAAGVHVGAVGPSVGGSAPFQQMADSLYTQFGAILELKLDAAAAAGDTATILDILIGAQQFGLTALADKAQGYLATGGAGP